MVPKSYDHILYEKKDRVATITFNRPEALNVLSTTLLGEMHDALQDAEVDENIRAIVVTGAGNKAFAAGADLHEIRALSAVEARNYSMTLHDHTRYMEKIQKPIVARINGYCLGGGEEIALACDFRIAADNARFGQPEVNLGLIPGAGGTQRLGRLVGKARAMEINMLGEHFDAQEAYRLGLINRVVPAQDLDKTVDEFVMKLVAKSPVILGIIKLAINRGSEMALDDALYYEAECFASALASEDSREGLQAFVEKRPADFKGR